MVKSNQIYKLTGKSFNRTYREKATKTRVSRKSRKEVMKQAKEVKSTMKSTVSGLLNQKPGLLNQKFKILEKVIMKAMRALKRKAVKSKTITGFMFNQVKAEVKQVAKHRKIRNIVLIKALENLRIDGSIQLKKGRNYLVKKKSVKPKKSGKSVTSKKKTKKARKPTNKKPDQKKSKFIKNHFKAIKKQATIPKIAAKSVKKIKKVLKTVKKSPTVKFVKIHSEFANEPKISETGAEPRPRRTVHPQKTDEEMSFYKQLGQKEEFSGDVILEADYEQETFVVSDTEMGHFAEDILEEARRESRKELEGINIPDWTSVSEEVVSKPEKVGLLKKITSTLSFLSSAPETVDPQKTSVVMSIYKQPFQKEDFSGDFGGDFSGDFSQESDYEQETFVVSDTEMGHFAEDILEDARRESRKELEEINIPDWTSVSEEVVSKPKKVGLLKKITSKISFLNFSTK